MQTPVQVTFRGLAHSDALDSVIQERMDWLEQFYRGIIGAKVLVEIPHRHRQSGRAVRVLITLSVPGRPQVVVTHEPASPTVLRGARGDEDAEEGPSEVETAAGDALTAVHRAFDAARRQLQEFARIERHEVKAHDRLATPKEPAVEPPPIADPAAS